MLSMTALTVCATVATLVARGSPPVTVSGPFWQPRMDAVRAGTLQANRQQCDATGRIANFKRAGDAITSNAPAGTNASGDYAGLLFNDSDVYKMMEGWAGLIATEPDQAKKQQLDKELDALIAAIARAQLADGYINTYYTLKVGADKRFTREQWDHETYCMGHLIEAGVAHYEATGKQTLLAVALKAARYLRGFYGPDKFTVPPGHQELELALVRLARATNKPEYADFALELIEYRGRPHRERNGATVEHWDEYAQDHLPASEQREAAGHAVRACYMYCAMADLAAQGKGNYRPALNALWDDITQRRMFVTGGIGPSAKNEGFTIPYDIPVEGAYQETCASIALCMWAQRMWNIEHNAKYMEQFERTLYNAVLAGVSQDGARFFYVNPMESKGGHVRKEWFDCACCPPNVLRFLADIGKHIYAVDGDVLYVNLFAQSKGSFVMNGAQVDVEQTTEYPFDGKVKITVRNGGTKDILIALRRNPGMQGTDELGYGRSKVPAGEEWTAEWTIPLPVLGYHSDPRVKQTAGMVAIVRGPLVYAAEAKDNPKGLDGLSIPASGTFEQRKDEAGVPIVTVNGIVLRPYFLWGNRGDGAMRIWFPETAAAPASAPATSAPRP